MRGIDRPGTAGRIDAVHAHRHVTNNETVGFEHTDTTGARIGAELGNRHLDRIHPRAQRPDTVGSQQQDIVGNDVATGVAIDDVAGCRHHDSSPGRNDIDSTAGRRHSTAGSERDGIARNRGGTATHGHKPVKN